MKLQKKDKYKMIITISTKDKYRSFGNDDESYLRTRARLPSAPYKVLYRDKKGKHRDGMS